MQVLAVVEQIPRGRVMSYGDVAEFIGSKAPRSVGAVMAKHGHEVCWWRVVQSSGHPTRSAPDEALAKLRAERTPLKGDRVDLARARWDGR
jgi:alkylated DNA nucleotide flippase Atl1